MRTLAVLLLLTACDPAGRPTLYQPAPETTGIHPEASTSDPAADEPRLDLGAAPPIPDLPADGSTSRGADTGSESSETGPASSSGGDIPGPESTSSTGAPDDSSSSTGGSSSTGEEPALVCGDGTCDPAERAPCWAWDGGWGDGFCYEDCHADPACLAVLDCACTPEAAAVKSWCFAEPLPACSATAPGGACEVSTALAFFMWNAKCG